MHKNAYAMVLVRGQNSLFLLHRDAGCPFVLSTKSRLRIFSGGKRMHAPFIDIFYYSRGPTNEQHCYMDEDDAYKPHRNIRKFKKLIIKTKSKATTKYVNAKKVPAIILKMRSQRRNAATLKTKKLGIRSEYSCWAFSYWKWKVGYTTYQRNRSNGHSNAFRVGCFCRCSAKPTRLRNYNFQVYFVEISR